MRLVWNVIQHQTESEEAYDEEMLRRQTTAAVRRRQPPQGQVTLYEIGKVSPADVKAKVSELMSGHESDYKHVTFDEYSKIFE